MNVVIANSKNVRCRIRRFLDRDALVIHPPVEIEKYRWLSQGDYYLSTSRLEPYKRVDLVVKAFQRMPDKKLIVVSGGTEISKLEKLALAFPNIHVVGWVAQAKLIELIGNSIASIYIPQNEDFGISPVESMAAGKPVIGVNEGGLIETVVQDKTGLLVSSKPKAEDIIQAVRELTPQRALKMRKACEERAQFFRPELYFKKIRDLVG